MLNFKQFMQNAAAFLNGTNDMNPDSRPQLPLTTVDIPTIRTESPITVFKVTKKGKSYEICAENNVSWSCPAMHYVHLLHAGKAPQVGDKVMLEFYRDGTVKSFSVVSKKQKQGLGDARG